MRKRLFRCMAAALAVAVSSVPFPTFAAEIAVENIEITEAAGESEEVSKAGGELLAKFDFESDAADGVFYGGDGVAAAKGNARLADRVGDWQGGKALELDGNSWLDVTKTDGSSILKGLSEMTVSFDVCVTEAGKNWVVFAAPDANAQTFLNENYVGMLLEPQITVERYHNSGARPGNSLTADASVNQWKHLTLVIKEQSTQLYVDGRLTAQSASDYRLGDIVGESGVFQIGKANWGTGEYFRGYLDNYAIYGSALTAKEVEAEYDALTAGNEITSLSEGYYLTTYTTTTPVYAPTGNLEQETRSVYMAVSRDGRNFEVLNHGGGVIFSKNTAGTLQITSPQVYRTGGGFQVVAPDASPSKGFHVFTSVDGVYYYDDEIVSKAPAIEKVLSKKSFTLMLKGENLVETDPNIVMGNALKITEKEYRYITDKLGTVVNTTISAPADITLTPEEGKNMTARQLSEKTGNVTANYSDGSVQEFDVDWSEALEQVDLSKAGTYTLTGRVNQVKYLNNLKKLNGSTLFEDDPNNENTDYPDNYDPETGKVYYDETKFVEGLADPMVYWDEQTGYYYMTGTYFPKAGDEIDGKDVLVQNDRIVLRKSRTLEGLQDRSNQVTIWKAGNQGYIDNGKEIDRGYRFIWAPEIHRVGDNWVVYFTEGQDAVNPFVIYCHALVLPGNQDPYETALQSSDEVSMWQDYRVVGGADTAINSLGNSFCLDMTYFKDEVSKKSYVVWAGTPTAAYQGANTDLFMGTIDEERPWVVTSQQVRITKADYGWERVRFCVNEGATVLQHDGNIFLCYSSSGTGSEYAIGMLRAKCGEDLLAEGAWTKNPYPVLSSRDVDGEEGPGHNSFTVDEYGNTIFVYHARPTSHNYKKCGWNGTSGTYSDEPLDDPCRHARFKRVHWAADGTPILKMTYAEELLEENQTVNLTVVVKGEPEKTPIPTQEPEKTPVPTQEPEKTDHREHVGKTFAVGDLKYKITRDNGKVQEVRVTSLKNKKAAKAVIPAKVTCKELKETFKVTAIKAKAFKGTNLKSVIIGSNVTTIGPNAFLNCKRLTAVTIGKRVKNIGIRAFCGCSKLKKVTIRSKVLKNVKKNAFSKISPKAVIKVPKGKKKTYKNRLKGKIAKGVKIK